MSRWHNKTIIFSSFKLSCANYANSTIICIAARMVGTWTACFLCSASSSLLSLSTQILSALSTWLISIFSRRRTRQPHVLASNNALLNVTAPSAIIVRKCAVRLRSFFISEIRERGSFYEDSFREGLCFVWLFEERVLSYSIEIN